MTILGEYTHKSETDKPESQQIKYRIVKSASRFNIERYNWHSSAWHFVAHEWTIFDAVDMCRTIAGGQQS